MQEAAHRQQICVYTNERVFIAFAFAFALNTATTCCFFSCHEAGNMFEKGTRYNAKALMKNIAFRFL